MGIHTHIKLLHCPSQSISYSSHHSMLWYICHCMHMYTYTYHTDSKLSRISRSVRPSWPTCKSQLRLSKCPSSWIATLLKFNHTTWATVNWKMTATLNWQDLMGRLLSFLASTTSSPYTSLPLLISCSPPVLSGVVEYGDLLTFGEREVSPL